MGHYKITVVRGHQGTKQNGETITFYYKATSLFHAIDMAKRQPGVKHDRCPVDARAVSEEEYLINIRVSAYKRAGIQK